jgi:hypothetical protein
MNRIAATRLAAEAAGLSVACFAPAIGHEHCSGNRARGRCVCECHAGRKPPKAEPGPRYLARMIGGK